MPRPSQIDRHDELDARQRPGSAGAAKAIGLEHLCAGPEIDSGGIARAIAGSVGSRAARRLAESRRALPQRKRRRKGAGGAYPLLHRHTRLELRRHDRFRRRDPAAHLDARR